MEVPDLLKKKDIKSNLNGVKPYFGKVVGYRQLVVHVDLHVRVIILYISDNTHVGY